MFVPRSIINQREFYRINLGFTVDILTGGEWITTEGQNISEGGLLIMCYQRTDIQLDQTVSLRIHLPECPLINARGLIESIQPRPSYSAPFKSEIVVRIIDITCEDHHSLVQFIFYYQARHGPVRTRE